MAPRLLFFFAFISLLLTFFPLPCSSLKYDDAMVVPATKDDDKVNVALYYESLCPGSAEFILKYLVDVFDLDLIDIVNLKLVPWGNAETTDPNNTIVCQHGEDECYFNTIHACAIEALPDTVRQASSLQYFKKYVTQPIHSLAAPAPTTKHFRFIHCLMKKTSEGPIHDKEEMWRSCCQGLKEVEQDIQNCFDSGHGRELELKYRNETPPHDYVPWLTVNDKHVELTKAVKFQSFANHCHQSRPKATENAISSTPVCYAKEASHF
ncbi:hypothetical protein Pint_34934 [Pistacia integerrima]|uniref:Uncharacterized protein n=1 Tax=Pistacia integerrima TaxID=434235 RepID=A0ACC0XZM4_9ROSI|nr:hypothetical protein Pint_34934 [Pistacia integerrima]